MILLLAGPLNPGSAQADLVFNVTEVGSDVVFNGGGSIDLTGLTADSSSATSLATGFLDQVFFQVGAATSTSVATHRSYYGTVTGPSSFGTSPASGGLPGTIEFTNINSGDFFGLSFGMQVPPFGGAAFNGVVVPEGYASKSALSGSATYAGETIASLSLTPGDYVWNVGNNEVSLTITSVPEPNTLSLLICAMGVLCLRKSRRHTCQPLSR